jgi:hypothetical protein
MSACQRVTKWGDWEGVVNESEKKGKRNRNGWWRGNG